MYGKMTVSGLQCIQINKCISMIDDQSNVTQSGCFIWIQNPDMSYAIITITHTNEDLMEENQEGKDIDWTKCHDSE